MESVKTPIFEGIGWDERHCMKDCFGMREQNFRSEEVIYEFDAPGGIIGILTEGTAILERIDENGSRSILEHLGTGSVFGEMLMFANVAGDHIAVVCEKPCQVWFMRANQLTKRCEKACDHHSRMVQNMFHLVAEKATTLSERVEILSRRSIRDKLLCYFNMQCAKTNTNRFTLPFSLSALADYISTDRSAMMRELKKLREEGVVEVDGRKVTLREPAC